MRVWPYKHFASTEEQGHTLEFSRHNTPDPHQKAATLQPLLKRRIVMPPKSTSFDKTQTRLPSYTNTPVAKRSDTQAEFIQEICLQYWLKRPQII